MFNVILSTTADNVYGGYASGIDTEKLFKFLFIVFFILSLILLIYIFYLKIKIEKLENNDLETNNNKEETSQS